MRYSIVLAAAVSALALSACDRPTVVVPHAYDQFALSWLVERIGAGARVAKSNRSRVTVSAALRRALSDAAIAARAAEIGRLLAAERDGAEVAVEAIVALPRAAER